jgi:L-ascorbate metabolism protein UlaG (beta-lactamase superfamily)
VIEPLLSDDALLAEVDRLRRRDPARPHLFWLGQSGYLLVLAEHAFLIDPYLSDSLTAKYASTDKPHVRISRRVIAPERLAFVDAILSTHNHTDHLDADTILPILRAKPDTRILVPAANRAFAAARLHLDPAALLCLGDGEHLNLGPLRVRAVPAAHPVLTRDPAGQLVHLGYLLTLAGVTLYHSGDTELFPGMADLLRPYKPDVALLPINGKVGNMNGTDAARLAKSIHAKLVIPCHYDLFAFNTADPADLLVPECQKLNQPCRVLHLGESLTLGGEP